MAKITIGRYRGKELAISFGAWRPGDQHYYVSDIRKFRSATGWYPKHSIQQGVAKLYQWLCEKRGLQVPFLLTTNEEPIKKAAVA